MVRMLALVVFSVLICKNVASSDAASPILVPVTDLGTLGGSVSWGYGINNQGQVVGTSQLPGDKLAHAFLYQNGKMHDLGTLGGGYSEAHAVNDAGQVTGTADLSVKDKHHAFLWQQGHMADLEPLQADDSNGLAINKTGQVAGSVQGGKFTTVQACVWRGGVIEVLDDPIRKGSESCAINSIGQTAGTLNKRGRDFTDLQAYGNYYSDHAVLWQGHQLSELKDAHAETSLAYAIDDNNEVAGAASFGSKMLLHACVWRDGQMMDLGSLNGQNTIVYAINSTGQVVGATNPTDLMEEDGKNIFDKDKPQTAFYYFHGKLADLNDLIDPNSGWVLAEARSLSDTGYVTGTGIHNGQVHAFLLKLPPSL